MKKRLSLWLFPFVLLASCSSYDPTIFINGVKEVVSTFETPTETTYTVVPKGHVVKFNEFYNWEDNSFDVPSGEVKKEVDENGNEVTTEIDLSESYASSLPIRLNLQNFYPEDDTKETPTEYAYGIFSYVLGYNADHIHFMDYKTEDGNLVLFIKNVSKPLSMNNVIVPNGPSKPKPVKVYARFNITATYNSKGLLIQEDIKTVNYKTDPAERTVDYVVDYTYHA